MKSPILMQSEHGYFIVAAHGYPSSRADKEGGYLFGSYKFNFKGTGDGFEEITSIVLTPRSQSQKIPAVFFIESHGIRYSLTNSIEENEYAKYFYSKQSSVFILRKMDNSKIFDSHLSYETLKYPLDLKSIPGTAFCLYLSSTDKFVDGKPWDETTMYYKLTFYVHEVNWGVGDRSSRSIIFNYHNLKLTFPFANKFIVLEDLSYVFVGNFQEYNNVHRGENLLDVCDLNQIANPRDPRINCSPKSEVLRRDVLKGCEKVLPIALSCVRCKERFNLVKKLGPDGRTFPFTKYCEVESCSRPTYINKALDDCYNCSKTFEGCEMCKDREEVCLSCQDHLRLDNGTCKMCAENCAECVSLTSCRVCKNGYELATQGKISQCMTCKASEFLLGLECVSCATEMNPECSECETKDGVCSKCKDGFVLGKDRGCQPHCKDLETCGECNQETGFCSKCKNGYQLEGEAFCRKICLQGTSWSGRNSNFCIDCSTEIFGCKECQDIAQRCTLCGEGLRLINFGKYCSPSCPEHYFLI